jgi:steroid 5-alpha reductase family enzyme
LLFPAWETFYVIVGSAAGALTGLMFVVIALVANVRTSSEPQIDAFGTPTVVHFGAVLLLFVGVHNAWDTVTYILVSRWARRGRSGGARDDAREERPL